MLRNGIRRCFVSNINFLILCGLVTLAACLRFYQLGDHSIWYDEALFANDSWGHGVFSEFLRENRSTNSSPILLPLIYYALGDSVRDPLSVKILPAVFGILSIAVTLSLPQVGIRRGIAVLSAAWMAILPSHIKYSQNVREYSFGILISSILLFCFCHARQSKGNQLSIIMFALSLFVAPLSSYGLCFASIIFLGSYLVLVFYEDKKINFTHMAVLGSSLTASLILSYLVTARYQVGLLKGWWLADYYPLQEGFLAGIVWLTSSTLSYFSFFTGGTIPGLVSIILLGVLVCKAGVAILSKTNFIIFVVVLCILSSSMAVAGYFPSAAVVPFITSFFLVLAAFSIFPSFIRRGILDKNVERQLVFPAFLLFAMPLSMSAMGLYPFGGIRQLVFAEPVILVCLIVVGDYILGITGLNRKIVVGLSAVIVLGSSIAQYSDVYSEFEDMVSAIRSIPQSLNDENVYITPGAVPSVEFHYPDRRFYRSETRAVNDYDFMAKEVSNHIQGCLMYMVFPTAHFGEDVALVEVLHRQGWEQSSKLKFKGAEVIAMKRCEAQQPSTSK